MRVQTSKREDNTGGKQEAARNLRLFKRSRYSSAGTKCDGKRGEVRKNDWTCGVSSVLCSNDRCDLLQPSPGGQRG